MDSGEQGLFGDLQTTVSTIAMTTTSASLAPPNDSRHGHHQVSVTHDWSCQPESFQVLTDQEII